MNNKIDEILEIKPQRKKEKEEPESKKTKTNNFSVPSIVFAIIGALIVLVGLAVLGSGPSASAGGFGWEGMPAVINSLVGLLVICFGVFFYLYHLSFS